MKLTYLGTAAAEGFPAVFCNCEFCKSARIKGGKNIRTRSQSLINGDLLIDFPADTYHHFLTYGIEGDRIKYLIVTHSHQDHLYTEDLMMRGGAYSHNMREEVLTVAADGVAYDKLSQARPRFTELIKISPFETLRLGEYEITALPARHGGGNIGALNYIIKGDKTLLYLHDTGYPYEETFDFIEKSGFRFDLVSYDCTNVDIPITNEGSHMGIPNDLAVRDRLISIGAVTDKTISVINHFSHNGNPDYDFLVGRVSDAGFLVSYDGLSIDF